MTNKTRSPWGLFVGFAIMLVWMSGLAAAHAFMTENLWQGALELIILAAVLFGVTRKRIRQRLETSSFSKTGLLVVAFVGLLVIIYEGRNLASTSPYLLGDLYIPAIVLIVRAVGSVVLAVVVLFGTGRLILLRT